MFLNAISTHLLNTARNGDSTVSLGSLFQCLTTFLLKKVFLISNLKLPCCNLKPFPLILSLVTWEETNTHLVTPSFQVLVESDKVSPQLLFLQAKQFHVAGNQFKIKYKIVTLLRVQTISP